MPWTESHTVLIRHRKLVELATALRIRPAHAIGHLHALWHAALEQQEDGDLSAWSDEFIAQASDYPGDAPQYVRLLQKYRWLDGRLIHDWLDYAGRYLEVKYRTRNPKKLEEIKETHRRRARDGPESDSGLTLDRQPYQTNLTNQPTTPDQRGRAGGFPASDQEAAVAADFVGCTPEFACKAWHKANGRGGCDARDVPIRNWRSYLRTEWCYEQEREAKEKQPEKVNGAITVVLGKELDRVLERMKTIKATYGDHQSWADEDVAEFNRLRLRRTELRKTLGVQA